MSKTTAMRRKRREEALTRPTTPVQNKRGGWKMSIPEFRKLYRAAEEAAGPADLGQIAEKTALHVTTVRDYRKREKSMRGC